MTIQRIHTRHLDLIPATVEILKSDLHDHTALARLLDATVPAAWPPGEMNDEVLTEFIRMASEQSDPVFACWYWVRDAPVPEYRILVGCGGIGSTVDSPGTVLIGYSVLDEFQGNGYATEAVGAMIPVIFQDRRISRIMATTYPELKASIRVLEKNSFACSGPTAPGEGLEEGTLGYVRERSRRADR
ncbi:GNAT family N-acetyltransferase [Methanoregula sp.]|jgi:RimJ/RimL family protein N-acetyltransferase|uniref:GNAT family N-acetyltransferase n=1 Tax=Methanoregula sp. TaxID=2052170 RepID=UPI00356836A7